ncbi:MAG: YafY family protein [Xanthobacteraceae bacterium]|nr:YafY family protein [Xanthobacteraceae bacterium]
MSRAARLLELIQIFRRSRRPVTAQTLAASLGVSERTVYRDILTLNGQGADIRGEAGLGYVLAAGFTLPPLMFTDDEIEAIILGLRWVAQRGDEDLARGASDASAKITDVLPPTLRQRADRTALRVAPVTRRPTGYRPAVVRAAMRDERKLEITYLDVAQRRTSRKIWPLMLGFFEHAEVLAAWCETRQDFRHFRIDRIVDARLTAEPLPRRRTALVAEWRRTNPAALAD